MARRNIQLEARDFYLQLKKVIVAFFGAQSAQLADFGLTPAKAHPKRTSAQNAVQAAKTKLTRAARGTASKKQKAAINPMVGTPAVNITPGSDKPLVTPPVVVNPGSAFGSIHEPAGSGTPAGSTPQSSAGSSTDASAPATPAGSGTPGK